MDLDTITCEPITCTPVKPKVDNSVIVYNYEGCFHSPSHPKSIDAYDLDPDNPSTDPTMWDSNNEAELMTKELCGRLCTLRGNFAYIGLWKEKKCFCKEKPPAILSKPMPEDECSTPCPGEGSEMCGGGQAMSIYNLKLGGEKQLDSFTKKMFTF